MPSFNTSHFEFPDGHVINGRFTVRSRIIAATQSVFSRLSKSCRVCRVCKCCRVLQEAGPSRRVVSKNGLCLLKMRFLGLKQGPGHSSRIGRAEPCAVTFFLAVF